MRNISPKALEADKWDADEFGYNRVRVRHRSLEEAMAEYAERIRYCEEKYEMSSDDMRSLLSTGDDKWETLEILKWMSADRAYQRLVQEGIPTDGKISTTTESHITGD